MEPRVKSCRPFRPLSVCVALGVAAQLAACHHSPLHRSHGMRLREMMAAQANAHPARDATARGEEAAAALRGYYDSYYSPDGGAVGSPIGGGGGAGGGGGGRGQMTAGVMPMH